MSFDRLNPYFGHIEERYPLTKPESTKETWHVRVNIKGSGIDFRVGDSIGILPKNDPEIVSRVLEQLQVPPDRVFHDPRTKEGVSAFELLSARYTITHLQKKVLLKISEYLPEAEKPEFLALLEKDDAWIRVHDLSDWLNFARNPQIPFDELLANLTPMLPRLYSIASSMLMHPHLLDLTVSRVCIEVAGKTRPGICSNYLTQVARILDPEVGLYLQPTKHFHFPQEDTTPVILIGPGTGVAPFRAYLQERIARGAHLGNVWLFFGERNSATDFLYEDFWNDLLRLPFFRMDVAFSRDAEHKVYVQHKMWEKREELLSWLDQGAKLYICGDAKGMARDVEAMFLAIFTERFHGDELKAREALKQLRKEGRYLRDVY